MPLAPPWEGKLTWGSTSQSHRERGASQCGSHAECRSDCSLHVSCIDLDSRLCQEFCKTAILKKWIFSPFFTFLPHSVLETARLTQRYFSFLECNTWLWQSYWRRTSLSMFLSASGGEILSHKCHGTFFKVAGRFWSRWIWSGWQEQTCVNMPPFAYLFSRFSSDFFKGLISTIISPCCTGT